MKKDHIDLDMTVMFQQLLELLLFLVTDVLQTRTLSKAVFSNGPGITSGTSDTGITGISH